MGEVVAECAKEQASGGLQKQAAIHRGAGCQSVGAERGPSRAA
jgi:hypothetical protein